MKIKLKTKFSLTTRILIAMILALVAGFLIRFFPGHTLFNTYVLNGILDVGGKVFIALLQMLVIPIVLASIICGSYQLGSGNQLGRLGAKTFFWFVFTTMVAILISMGMANILHIGANITLSATPIDLKPAPSLKEVLISFVPKNPIASMANGELIALIVFSILFGIALSKSGEAGKRLANFFEDLNTVLMKFMMMIMQTAPIGVFCLITKVFAELGLNFLQELSLYFIAIFIALAIQLFGIYGLLLALISKLNPFVYFRKTYPVMLFAFSTASSNATIPLHLSICEEKLGVPKSIASFAIPLGATAHMDGSAIMQAAAAIFIANVYHIPLDFSAYLLMFLLITIVSRSAGIPGASMITLAIVLQQVGIPIEGIGLVLGIDRLVDMLRTILNVIGDSVSAVLISQSEGTLDIAQYNAKA